MRPASASAEDASFIRPRLRPATTSSQTRPPRSASVMCRRGERRTTTLVQGERTPVQPSTRRVLAIDSLNGLRGSETWLVHVPWFGTPHVKPRPVSMSSFNPLPR